MLTNHMVTRLYEGKLERVMGKEDFFFCHWYADSADDIMDCLDKAGFHEIMITMPSEMQRYVSVENSQDKKLVNPED